jgi:acyl-CoA hydrolase
VINPNGDELNLIVPFEVGDNIWTYAVIEELHSSSLALRLRVIDHQKVCVIQSNCDKLIP